MVNIELRSTHPGGWRELLELPADGILVGDTSCPHKLPSGQELRACWDAALEAGWSFRLELPPAFEGHYNRLLQLVEELVSHREGLDLVLNDWGVAVGIREVGLPDKVRMSAGPLLSFSFAHCPWHEAILVEELAEVQAGVQVLSLDSPHGVSLLRSMGVSGLETDLIRELGPSWSNLARSGFSVSGRAGYSLVASSRLCHTARLHNRAIGLCQELCRQPTELETTHRWSLFDNTQKRLDPPVRRSLPVLSLWGNAVYAPLTEPPERDHLAVLDRVTIDDRHWDKAGLRDQISYWKERLMA